jgi:hypothetical protein
MSNQPVNQHYLPECYLKQFANLEGQIWKREKNHQTAKYKTPAQICYVKDGFTIRQNETLQVNNITDNYFIEKNSFKRQENDYVKIIPLLIEYVDTEKTILASDSYFLFLETIVTIKRRNPEAREQLIHLFKALLDTEAYKSETKEYITTVSRGLGIELDPEIYFKDRLVKVKNADKLHDISLSPFIERSQNDIINTITSQFYDLKQIILHPPSNFKFITSDDPGFIANKDRISSLGGLGQPFKFFFPLSPNACLLVDSTMVEKEKGNHRFISHLLIKKEEVDEINQCTKKLCTTFIIGNSKEIAESI